jgi:hypothetical protein
VEDLLSVVPASLITFAKQLSQNVRQGAVAGRLPDQWDDVEVEGEGGTLQLWCLLKMAKLIPWTKRSVLFAQRFGMPRESR